ncbi:MAG: TetR/AcrR family transcriptional regulator [Gemmatimonadetes bacterium]|nr:TetR/AcrR family transcriptional regulator [Gemmatimonadota bacterium]
MPDPLTYARHLAVRANLITRGRSGERTRLKLLAAGANLLDRLSYRDLNVAAITRQADSAKGTFYVYFDTKDEFLTELLHGYVVFEATTFPTLPRTGSPFRAYRDRIAWYERTFARNAGILRCMLQMSETHPEIRRIWHDRNAWVVDRALRETIALLEKPPHDLRPLRLAIRATGTMLDQSLFERYGVSVGPGIEETNPELLLEFHAVLGFRALFGQNPPAKNLKYTRGLVKIPKLR